MANLFNYRKPDLKTLAEELGVENSLTDTIPQIIAKIEAAPLFNREMALAQIKLIVEDRKQLENERIEAEKRQIEAGKWEKERQIEAEKRLFELEKLKLTQTAETESLASSREVRRATVSLKNVMQKFDPEKSDMALFLNLFQRQAKKAQLEEDELVTQLLALLPVNIAELIIREPEEKLDDFEYIKTKLLDRFKLSPESFRNKFVTHQRRPDALWKDLNFELGSYLDGWLEGLEVTNFEQLKKLMIVDQIKRRATSEMKESLIDSWSKITDPEILVGKLDEFEANRKPNKRTWNFKSQEDKRVDKIRGTKNSPRKETLRE